MIARLVFVLLVSLACAGGMLGALLLIPQLPGTSRHNPMEPICLPSIQPCMP